MIVDGQHRKHNSIRKNNHDISMETGSAVSSFFVSETPMLVRSSRAANFSNSSFGIMDFDV